MQASGETSSRENRSAFWKKNSKTVPGSMKAVFGAQHPPITSDWSPQASPARHASAESGTAANFQHFQQSVEDAWDDGDDEFCIISGKIQRDVKISENLAQSAALNVIQSHRKSSGGGGPNARRDSSEASPPPPAQPAARPAVTAAGKAEAMIRLAAQRPSAGDGQPAGLMNPASCPRLPGHPQPLRPGAVLRHPPVRYLQQKANAGIEREVARLEKVGAAVKGGTATLDELRALCWGGIPAAVRPVAWRLLAGYLPLPLERREPTLCRKRDEYWSFVQQYYDTRHDDLHQDTYRQIHIDIPRMSPLIPLFQQLCVQQMFERVLYIWAIRHPASGYVQGVNDLLTPYFIVFLQEVLPPDADIESYDVASLPESERRVIEADSFWSMSLLLDGIQDNYTFAQPGIQTKVTQLKELVQRIDAPLDAHIGRHGIDYLQFAFRWMNNLLMRELPLHCTIRLWDTYLSETEGFASFHLYVCAAFLTSWSELLMRQRDFQGLMLTLQNLPTHNWTNSEVRVLVAEAFKLKYTFADAPNHLASRTK